MALHRDVLTKLTEARTTLVLDQPFFGMLALRLAIEEAPKVVSTARTDGTRLQVNQDWVRGLSAAELRGVIAHETMHAALGHAARRHGRDLKLWNLAGDHVINLELLASGFTLPAKNVHDPRFAGKSTDQIFATLLAERRQDQAGGGGKAKGGGGALPGGKGKPQPGNGPQGAPQGPQPGTESADDDPGGCGGVEDSPAADGGQATEADLEASVREWEVAVTRRHRRRVPQGNSPATSTGWPRRSSPPRPIGAPCCAASSSTAPAPNRPGPGPTAA